MTATKQRRTRRGSDEIRELVLRAARETFAAHGYAGATTRAIAQRAEVTEATLFRLFSSKEGLFDAAVLGPFEDFLAAFTRTWMQAPIPGGTPEEVLPQFVAGVYHLVREHRDLFAAMTYSEVLGARTRAALDQVELLGETIAEQQQLPFDARVAVRVATTTVVSVAMLEDALFPPGSGIGRERIVGEIARMLIGAARYVPPERARADVTLPS